MEPPSLDGTGSAQRCFVPQDVPCKISDHGDFASPGRDRSSAAVYYPGLDGLRGVAVLAVLLYHSGLIRGGFLGVDIFFTLSGFLITRLLLHERAATGTIRFRHFFLRRALRLLPALFAFLVLWTCALLATIPSTYWGIVGQYVVAVLLYVANWAGIYGLPMGIFGHAWSLAIEEQFYFLWPVVVALLISKVRHPKLIVGFLAFVALMSLAWRLSLALDGASERRIYWATDAHADGLLLGAAAAFLAISPHPSRGAGLPHPVAGLIAATGLGGLLLTAAYNPSYVYGGTGLTAIATVTVILAIVRGSSFLARLLGMQWLVWVGRISYGLYLWHFPIFSQFGVLKLPGEVAPHVQVFLAWGATFGIAFASYVFIERPALAYRDRFRWARTNVAPARHAPRHAFGATESPSVPSSLA